MNEAEIGLEKKRIQDTRVMSISQFMTLFLKDVSAGLNKMGMEQRVQGLCLWNCDCGGAACDTAASSNYSGDGG